MEKKIQSSKERFQINLNLVAKVRELLKDKPLEVIGHLDSPAICCGDGTVAIVKIDLDTVASEHRSKKP